jgi:uncharacterized protein (TIGR03118 family)
MTRYTRFLKPTLVAFALLLPTLTFAQHYTQTNLVSNISGMAASTDPHLKNPWGLARGAATPFWAANNGDGTSTLYTGLGQIIPRVFTVPAPPDKPGTSTPTGVVFNGTTDFAASPGNPSIFIFVTEDGTISGWNPTNPDPSAAVIKVDNSKKGAVYKGATMSQVGGRHFLYVANFHSGRIEVYDAKFNRVHLSEELFDDDRLPHGFAPFNVQAIGKNIYVMYAKQDAEKKDEVGGPGLGFVDVFSPAGKLRARLQHTAWLNAPWGVALAPGEFGEFSHALLVGNFQGKNIAAFNPVTGKFIGNMHNPDGTVLKIDGLWALSFGNGTVASATTLFFTAGINDEADGLFGSLTPVPAELNEEDEP